jgi:hypothetical protein
MMKDHNLPEKFFAMDYDEFLHGRPQFMAKMIRSTFESL